ncbi:hypothetical protein QUA41_03205 [Microcoleus sp. Pol11C1]
MNSFKASDRGTQFLTLGVIVTAIAFLSEFYHKFCAVSLTQGSLL